MNKKLTIEFVRISFETEGYTLLDTVYVNSCTKLNYVCPYGHKHSIMWNNWRLGKRCPYCAGLVKYTIEFVREKFEKESYILLSNEYIGAHSKLDYICPKGHKHNISWNDWRIGHRCPTCFKNNYVGENTFLWKGGVNDRQIALYDTYSLQIDFCEETRRDPTDLDLLQVRCTKCESWFSPSLNNVKSRIASLNGSKGECRFYCSNECKHTCSIFNKVKYSADEKRSKTNSNFTSAELSIWSKEVLKRANNTCEYCGNYATEAHHILPKKLKPFYALDPDNGIACCEECHYKYGHTGSCSTGALANTICD